MWSIIIGRKNLNFNSHAHVERDDDEDMLFYNGRISTHTLTWSVTGVAAVDSKADAISTHTLTWSVTINPMFNGKYKSFQLTRSRGA